MEPGQWAPRLSTTHIVLLDTLDAMGDPPPAYEIYAKQLFPRRHGYPLWHPEPDETYGEIQIGDVGRFRQGAFWGLFNACLPTDHEQPFGTPDNYEPFVPGIAHTRVHKEVIKTSLESKTVSSIDIGGGAQTSLETFGGGLKFSCSSQQGAFVFVKPPADRKQLHPSKHSLANYIRTHFEEWYNFSTGSGDSGGLDLDISREDIIFISGTVKTEDWGLGAFVDSSAGGEVSFQGSAGPFAQGSFNCSYTKKSQGNTEYRTKPMSDSLSITHPSLAAESASLISHSPTSSTLSGVSCTAKKDQCLFVHYYKMKKRLWLSRFMQAAADDNQSDARGPGSHDPGGTAPTASDTEDFAEEPGIDRAYDPVDFVLDYILDFRFKDGSRTEVAFAGTEDLYTLFSDGDIPEDIQAALRSRRPPVLRIDSEVAVLAYGVKPDEGFVAAGFEHATDTHIASDPKNTSLSRTRNIEPMDSLDPPLKSPIATGTDYGRMGALSEETSAAGTWKPRVPESTSGKSRWSTPENPVQSWFAGPITSDPEEFRTRSPGVAQKKTIVDEFAHDDASKAVLEGMQELIHILQEVAKIHLFITAAVDAFRVAAEFNMKRRDNDMRLNTVFGSMAKMMTALTLLRHVPDPTQTDSHGMTVQQRLRGMVDVVVSDVWNCASACDVYAKKSILAKVVFSSHWCDTFMQYVRRFQKHQTYTVDAVSIYIGNNIADMDEIPDLDTVISKITFLKNNEDVSDHLQEFTSDEEKELAAFIRVRGGHDVILKSKRLQTELALNHKSVLSEHGAPGASKGAIGAGDTLNLRWLQEELTEEPRLSIARNRSTFEYKFESQHRFFEHEDSHASSAKRAERRSPTPTSRMHESAAAFPAEV
ncbi:hypothetical protein C8Q77DRAFT_1077109 [Trametes polyzona]|nr:hypothetical protein C8Q77DRAFT_1077109 [Trametes polyzona]